MRSRRRAEEVADDAPVRQRTLAALARWDTCSICKGAGQIREARARWHTCPTCEGAGVIRKEGRAGRGSAPAAEPGRCKDLSAGDGRGGRRG
jgi:DnaJ-class molecular chaperone